MGVDAHYSIPPQAKFEDIYTAILAMSGNKPQREPRTDRYEGNRSFFWRWPKRVWKYDTHVTGPEVVWLTGPTPVRAEHGGSESIWWQFGFEDSVYPGNKYLFSTSNGYFVAVCIRLARLFGGTVDFKDIDDVDNDLVVRFEDSELGRIMSTGQNMGDEGWWQLQDLVYLQPELSKDEIEFANACAYWHEVG